MGYSFDTTNYIIELTTGTTVLDVKDLYSRWKEWVKTGVGSKYNNIFTSIGGDAIDSTNGIYIPPYIFLTNNWKIKPQETNHKLTVTNGILSVDGGGDPFVSTSGSYNVQINYQQPVNAVGISSQATSGTIDIEDVYQAKITLHDDKTTQTNKYTVVFFKNSKPITSGITSPKIQVIKTGDGTDLISEIYLEQIGSYGLYRHFETSNRIVNGMAYVVKSSVIIDEETRIWYQPIGRST
jgi:hypothetical protein